MSTSLLVLQALLVVAAVIAVAQRSRLLLFEAPASPVLVAAWSAALSSGDESFARRLVQAAPARWGSRLILAALDPEATDRSEAVATMLSELRLEATAQLGFIRVAATLGSTLGLLGGILAIQRGFSGQGLLALSAGLAQQVALNQALSHMAIGIGTAAFCFAAFGLLRTAARDLLTQLSQVAARCRADIPPATVTG